MSKKHDGGPAFPLPCENSMGVKRLHDEGELRTEFVAKTLKEFQGISVRDYFAAKAMQNYMRDDCTPDAIARAAYEMADAMLKARSKP